MTRGVLELPRVPGMAPAGRAASPTRALTLALAAVLLALCLADHVWAKKGLLPEGIITEVKIEGNVSLTSDDIRRKLLCRPGQELNQERIDADVRSLNNTKWFSSVNAYTKDDPERKGYILIYTVREMPVLTYVEFRGRKKNVFGVYKVSQKDLEETTGLKAGNRADATRTQLAVGQIQRLYAEKGYDMCEVRLVEGGNRGDTRVVIEVFEGEKRTVGHINFEGNTFVSSERLRTKVTSRRPIAGLIGGIYHADAIEDDARKLREFYQSQGFYEVRVNPITHPGDTLGDMRITFVISEGVRYHVRNIKFEGNKRLTEAKLREGLLLHSGQPMLESLKDSDSLRLMSKYYELGCLNTQILAQARITEQPGVLDLVYNIQEGTPIVMGDLIVKGNDRTQDRVIRREANMAGLMPGELLDKNRIDIFKKRLGATGYFINAPDQNKVIKVEVGQARDKPYGDLPTIEINETTRMQDPGVDASMPAVQVPPLPPPPANGGGVGAGAPAAAPGAGGAGVEERPIGGREDFYPPVDTMPPSTVPPAGPVALPPSGVAPPGALPRTPPIGTDVPNGMIPNVPGMNATDVGPDRNDPYTNRQYADVITSIEEAPTGRFMLGVGASGAQGLYGNATIIENNFNIWNYPRSWAEVTNGQAFRGGGQQLQVSAMVGTLINRFTVSLIDKMIFDLPIAGGATGYIFNRFYPDWSEARGGGRFWLGRQFGQVIYADVAFRAEEVDFYGYRTPAPADYLAANGHTALFSLRPSIRYDTRNAPFMPNKGQYVEASFEQGWGSFTYPKFELEGRTYFTLGTRADGSGPRTLELRGHYGVTGPDTPVYERFFAGYFGSLRGFMYRGVGPHILGSNAGGLMEALGSVEYMLPLTASDKVRQVFFCDFGTVTPNYEWDNFRVAIGTGLRLNLPALGPLPLAFDLAFPLVKAPGDHVQYFNFTMGANY
ncbi:MAG: POTRA domain-containing protein [Isosphaeraceae bacterium]|nr:POTRA domain-containing protein [Isosphaeraceae bacterium]